MAQAGGIVIILLMCFFSLNALYLMGKQGESCYSACLSKGYICDGSIITGNNTKIFQDLGIQCVADKQAWWADNQPCFVSGKSDPNYGKCLGFVDVSAQVWCGGAYPTVSRLCHCSAPSPGYSGGEVNGIETDIFTHVLSPSHHGVMNHFWLTGMEHVMALTRVNYYVDGELIPSISFIPPLACGVGFDNDPSPFNWDSDQVWGTEWMGKGAKDGAWYLNFKIPFQKNIRITVQSTDGRAYGGFYIIVRGAQDVPIFYDGLTVPSTCKLLLQVFNKSVVPLEYVPIINVPKGRGVFFMQTLSVRSGNMNFLEGCYHAYSPYNAPYPGVLLSTGTEDYFDSAWYFNGGEFHLPNAGFTHLGAADNVSSKNITFSAYRFHFKDPLPFNNGLKIVWRNGDTMNPKTGLKCFMEQGGNPAGNPQPSNVIAYGWVYVCP